ncbi:MAG TPA: hypothetical protein VH684_16625 [Xanthobacteraceae bacterium]|jgi:hypothetical protein
MEHKTLRDVQQLAAVYPEKGASASEVRRSRLERLASLLEHEVKPLSLFSQVEFLRTEQLEPLRVDNSPLTIAYADPVFRAQGLASDRYGEAMRFFDLTSHEAHFLLCDCHYYGAYYGVAIRPEMLARRARSLARRMRVGELLQSFRGWIRDLWQR